MKIKDQLLEPYYINVTDNSYDVIKEVKVSDVKSKNFGKITEQNFGYFSKLDNALLKIAKLKLIKNNQEINLSSYINAYRDMLEKIKLALTEYA